MCPQQDRHSPRRSSWNVRGSLFSDYVRMIRSHKNVDWEYHLPPEDLAFMSQQIRPAAWYPMATFERLGNAILDEIAGGDLQSVRAWGRESVDRLRSLHPQLVMEGDPVESLQRLRVLRGTFFDFQALEVLSLTMKRASVGISYYMGRKAEEAACHQTMGVLERVVELSGGSQVTADLPERAWDGNERTLLDLKWRPPPITGGS